MNFAKKYVDGLKKAYYQAGGKAQWDDFEQRVHGATKEELERLQAQYPQIPDSLLGLLNFVDGTYFRKYGKEKIAFYFLGSDLEEYPYYLLSVKQMLQKEKVDWLTDYINREFGEEIEIDEKITDNADNLSWLHFSDCMNSGGTSKLFLDFSPSAKGVSGQVVRFLHDPDELMVIADSFDAYLQMLIDNEYDFISEDIIEEQS